MRVLNHVIARKSVPYPDIGRPLDFIYEMTHLGLPGEHCSHNVDIPELHDRCSAL
jgi:hypothetical protein